MVFVSSPIRSGISGHSFVTVAQRVAGRTAGAVRSVDPISRKGITGRSAEGLALLDRAIAAIDEPGVGFYLPEIYRLRGECLLALGRGNMDRRGRLSRLRATSPFGKARSSSSAAPKHPLARLRIFGLSDSGNAAVGSQRTARKGGSWHMVAGSHAVVFCSVEIRLRRTGCAQFGFGLTRFCLRGRRRAETSRPGL